MTGGLTDPHLLNSLTGSVAVVLLLSVGKKSVSELKMEKGNIHSCLVYCLKRKTNYSTALT